MRSQRKPTLAEHAAIEPSASQHHTKRDALRDRIMREMTRALASAGDQYQAPDGVHYSLSDEPAPDRAVGDGRLIRGELARV